MKTICWWSGGITSAVACKVAIDMFGKENCRVIMIDTRNEDDDTYRFKDDCEKWYEIEIETIDNFGGDYECIQDVWEKHLSLNTANGAICSSRLKIEARKKWQKTNEYKNQVFGFEFNAKEFKRAMGIKLNYPKAKPIFPLMMLAYDKEKCFEIVKEAGIRLPDAYTKYGLHNNNCLKTLCIQGTIGYWQKAMREHPDKYMTMGKLEQKLTKKKGKPITINKDQSNASIELAVKLNLGRKYCPVFLLPNEDYPEFKDVMSMKPRKLEPLVDCNGFCPSDTADLIEQGDLL